jgi:hypothetical protein
LWFQHRASSVAPPISPLRNRSVAYEA